MIKKLLPVILFFLSLTVFSQENLKGYYITKEGKKTEGYFKPGNFFNENYLMFKSAQDGEYVNLDPKLLKEYAIEDNVKFEKHTVKVDNSNLEDRTGVASNSKQPIWIERTVFLNVITEGDASLYSYSSDMGVKYFYKIDSKSIALSQLIYKKYQVDQLNIGENNQYKQQLFNDLSCEGQVVGNFLKVRYSKNDLVKVVENYNMCHGSATKNYSATKSKKVKFKYTIFAGVNNTKFSVEKTYPVLSEVSKANFNFGGEAEMLLPSRKLSFFLKAEYESFSGENLNEIVTPTRYTKVSYNIDATFFNIYLGPRYYFALNNKNKLFADGGVAISLVSGDLSRTHVTTVDTGTVTYVPLFLKPNECIFFNFGIGYAYNEKFGIDLRLDTNRNVFDKKFTTEKSKFNRIGVNLRYSIN